MLFTLGKELGRSDTKIPIHNPRGLATENIRFEMIYDLTDKLDCTMFKPRKKFILS